MFSFSTSDCRIFSLAKNSSAQQAVAKTHPLKMIVRIEKNSGVSFQEKLPNPAGSQAFGADAAAIRIWRIGCPNRAIQRCSTL
jgi:hypothetical protein